MELVTTSPSSHKKHPSYMRRRAVTLAGIMLIAASSFLLGCEEPQVVSASSPATVGGIEFKVLPYEMRLLELDSGDSVVKYAKPVMIIPIEMKNVGKDDFVYSPKHDAQQTTEQTSPLLYIDPKKEDEKLPPKQKNIINGALLLAGNLKEQQAQRITLKPGQSITDYYLFEDPGKNPLDLILSIPPDMNRGELPLLFKLPYTPQAPKGPKIESEGEAVKLGNISLTVTGHKVEYVPVTDANKGKGFTSQPLLKIDFTVKNDGDTAISYSPDHRSDGRPGPGLYAVDRTLERAKLLPTMDADGQVTLPQSIEPGQSISDFLLFMPPTQSGEVKLEFPGSLFGQPGLARFLLDVANPNPPKPEAMVKPKVIEKPADD